MYPQDYDDTPHIYLDLFAAYRSICLKYREENVISCQSLKDDIDYIADRKYTDTPGGGMYSLKASMEGEGADRTNQRKQQRA